MAVGARIIAAALAAGVGMAGCADRAHTPSAPLVRTHETMGSAVQVTVWTADRARASQVVEAVFAEFDRLDAVLSVWQPDSDVVRLNAAAGRDAVPVSADTRTVLHAARQVSEWTGGKFDVTFGALTDVWKFDHDRDGRVPTDSEIAARLPFIDYTAVRVDDGAGTAGIARAGVRIHLGGIGKGYAVDRAAAILRAQGFPDFLIQAGGDLYAGGTAGGEPWRLGIQDPRAPAANGGSALDDSFASFELRDATLSTSGDYERAFVSDGKRYHHLLDPDTGQPAQGAMSVSIVAKTAMLADALSTGVFILGPERGMALVERLPDVEAVIVSAAGEVLISRGLQERVRLRDPVRRLR